MFRDKCTLTPREAIASVLDTDDEYATCATVKVENDDESFCIEYLNHPDDSECFYNVTTDALASVPEGFVVEDSGPGFTVIATNTENVSGVLGEVVTLAKAASPQQEFTFRGAATKDVPAAGATPGEIFVRLVEKYNPLS